MKLFFLEMGKIERSQKILIIEFMQSGCSLREVSRTLGIARTTVRNIWQKYLQGLPLENRNSSGRPRILSKRDERRILVKIKKNPFLSAKELLEFIPDDKHVCAGTIRYLLRRNNLFSHRAARKPLLSDVNRRKRLAWCKSYKSWDATQWKNVIFSDECRVEQYSKRRMLVRRQSGQRNMHQFVTKTVKYGGFSVMVWGAIKGDGTKVLYRCPTILNSEGYMQIIEGSLLPMLDSNSVFMQDGAPCHTSKATMSVIDKHKVCILSDWPPQSPDINIIENLWAKVKKNISRKQPVNKNELWELLKLEWDNIDTTDILQLYASIPRRLHDVIKAKGLHTKY